MTAIPVGALRANPFNLAATMLDDVGVAITRVDEMGGRIQQLLAQFGEHQLDDAALAASKDARIGAFRVGKEAQGRLEPHLDEALDAAVLSRLRNADASLEDASWQLASKPSPDLRFNGVDLPGALRDTRAASEILSALAPII